MTRRRRLALLIAWGMLAGGLTAALPAVPALAATHSCVGNTFGCVGYDPAQAGCNVDTTTTAYAYVNDDPSEPVLATLWNRYSGNCNANWSRAQLTQTAINAGYVMHTFVFTTDTRGQNGTLEQMCYPGYPENVGATFENCTGVQGDYGGSAIAYSDMVNGTKKAYAWVVIYDRSGNEVSFATVAQ